MIVFSLSDLAIVATDADKDKCDEQTLKHIITCFLGTIFLWMYWPSFNGAGAEGDEQHRAFINTYLSLCACTVVTFAVCALYDKKGKFTMVCTCLHS